MLPALAGSVLCVLFYADENQRTEIKKSKVVQEVFK